MFKTNNKEIRRALLMLFSRFHCYLGIDLHIVFVISLLILKQCILFTSASRNALQMNLNESLSWIKISLKFTITTIKNHLRKKIMKKRQNFQ